MYWLSVFALLFHCWIFISGHVIQHQTSPKKQLLKLHLSGTEISKILLDRAKDKATKQHIHFTSQELDKLWDKVENRFLHSSNTLIKTVNKRGTTHKKSGGFKANEEKLASVRAPNQDSLEIQWELEQKKSQNKASIPEPKVTVIQAELVNNTNQMVGSKGKASNSNSSSGDSWTIKGPYENNESFEKLYRVQNKTLQELNNIKDRINLRLKRSEIQILPFDSDENEIDWVSSGHYELVHPSDSYNKIENERYNEKNRIVDVPRNVVHFAKDFTKNLLTQMGRFFQLLRYKTDKYFNV